jgi:hypothetical protein
MKRMTRELTEAEIAAATTTNQDVEATLARALTAAQYCLRAYLTASGPVRRQINRGFFEKLFIGQDGPVVQAVMTEPFRSLLPPTGGRPAERAAQNGPDAPDGGQNHTDRLHMQVVGGMKDEGLVGAPRPHTPGPVGRRPPRLAPR